MTGYRIGRQLSLTSRQELIQAITQLYRCVTRSEKKQILDEFTQATGFHRKHAIRALKRTNLEFGHLSGSGENHMLVTAMRLQRFHGLGPLVPLLA
jgi:hypothetical protein